MSWLSKFFGPGLGTCDVCNESTAWADGYVLSTSQVAASRAYWEFAFTHQWSYAQSLDKDGGMVGILVQQQAAQPDGWLVCESCSHQFTFDRKVAKYHAKRKSSAPPGSGPVSVQEAALAAAEAWEKLYGTWPSGVEIKKVERKSQPTEENYLVFTPGLNKQAMEYQEMGKYDDAEALYLQILEVHRNQSSEDHLGFAITLNNFAALYQKMGKYSAAESLLRQAVEIYHKTIGENHPEFATSLNNLAALYRSMGNYPAAEPLYRQAVKIWRTSLGEKHPDFAQGLSNLALLYQTVGNYVAAKHLYDQALEIWRASVGERHPDFARCLSSLAALYREIGNNTLSESLHRQALEIRRGILGEKHPDFATSLSNLAETYKSTGKYADAEPLLLQAIEIRRKTLGENHPYYAISLTNLADWYQQNGNYATAIVHYRLASDIFRQALGDEHPDFAHSLGSLAGLWVLMGNYGAAEPLLRQAVATERKALGKDHPIYAARLHNLAVLCVSRGQHNEAFTMMKQAASSYDKVIGQIFSISSENQRMAYLKAIEPQLDALLSLTLQGFSNSFTSVRTAFELVLRRKAIGAEALAAQRDAVQGEKYPTLKPKLRQLMEVRRQIAQKTLAGPGPEGLPTHQQLLAEWNTEKETLEAELASQVPEINLEKKLRAASRQVVALALPEESALIEFVRFNVFDFKAVPIRSEPSYLAFVLPAGEPGNMRMIDLGEAEPIERMIATFRAAITGEEETTGERGLGAWPGAQGGAASGGAGGGRGEREGQALRAALFDPLAQALGRRTRLLLAPDGDLTRLPFEVLPLDDGRRLIDEYQISYLGAGRDVLRWGAAVSGEASAPLVAADPDFDLSAAHGRDASSGEQNAGKPVPGRRSRDLQRGLTTVARLEGTLAEGRRIAAMLGVEPWLDNRALEARLKACRSPRILHLATHGFFLADQKRDPNETGRGLGALGVAGEWGRMVGPGMENPLLRSGLLLAGFNTWLAGDSLPAEAEDGILTAEDVSGLDLLATELVVLSACETGLGEIHVGEGVFGLRRAFVLAGAKTLVMSLWKVPDEQTRELMEDFYGRILRGEGRAEALQQAQLAIKRKYPDPFFWGAFICQGEPGPLSALS